MESTAFWSELEARIGKFDLLCHPFYKAWSEGKLTREDLRDYAADYYPQVAGFPEYLNALAGRLPAGELRRAVEENRDDENGIGSPDGRSHADLWLDFAEGMGAQREAARDSAVPAEVNELTAFFQKKAQHGSALEALAAFYAYESQVPRVAQEKARGLREMYEADAKTRFYFTLHTTADVHHANVWRQQMNEMLKSAPVEAQRQALDSAEAAAKMLWRALDGIERERLSRAA